MPEMTTINEDLIKTLLPGKILAVQVGFSRIAVMAQTDDGIRCGLAATLSNPDFEHHCHPAVRNAGHLLEMSATELAELVDSSSFTEAAIGLATINALLPRNPDEWVELNAEDYLAQQAVNKNVAIVGHFPFINRMRSIAKNAWVLELNPRDGDLPAEAAPEIIPQADYIAITATTMINGTLPGLLALCRSDAHVILIGPSTPLSPVLYDHGINTLSGAIVSDPQTTLLGISQGISLSQLRRAGVISLVTIQKRP